MPIARRYVLNLACFIGTILLPAIASSAEMRVVNTPHYQIHTELDAEFSDDLARRMEAMHAEYCRRLAIFGTEDAHAPFKVYLFQTRESYLQLVGEELRNTGGVFSPRRKALAAFLEGQGRDQLRRTLQHEAFHQFAHTAIQGELPIWLNEGLAQYFQECLWMPLDRRPVSRQPGPRPSRPPASCRHESASAVRFCPIVRANA
jgi:hypothetical protein